jgi:hypothetical protein
MSRHDYVKALREMETAFNELLLTAKNLSLHDSVDYRSSEIKRESRGQERKSHDDRENYGDRSEARDENRLSGRDYRVKQDEDEDYLRNISGDRRYVDTQGTSKLLKGFEENKDGSYRCLDCKSNLQIASISKHLSTKKHKANMYETFSK